MSKRLLEMFPSDLWVTVGYIVHVPGCGTTDALLALVSVDTLVIAPKMLHSEVKRTRPEVEVVSPEYFVRHSAAAGNDTVLVIMVDRPRGVSVVFRRRKI